MTHRYAELHAHSAYSFLDGANEPEDLVQAAMDLGLEALALTDHDGVPGIVRHAQAGRSLGLPTAHGAELTVADGSHLPVLARGPEGYRRLVSAISRHNLGTGHRAEPAHDLLVLAQALHGCSTGGGSLGTGTPTSAPACLVLTGTANGPLRRALGDPRRPQDWDLAAADSCLGRLVELFADPDRPRYQDRDMVGTAAGTPQASACAGLAVEIALDGGPCDAALTEVLSRLARAHHLPLVATGAVRCARPGDAPVADVLTATRLATDLEGARGYLPATGRWLRGAQDMVRLHRRLPAAVEAAAQIGAEIAFDLSLIAPDLPSPEVPHGHTPATWLRELTRRGATSRYGTPEEDPRAWQVLEHELAVIEQRGFPGYFLIVRSVVDFCERQGILCQGRGSAANSAVCYALGITAVDAVRHRMLFERFLSPGRSGYPDIDLDIEACRREEVIQHVYTRYGRDYAAQVANVISYRPRSAVRDAARALGYPPGVQDAWASQAGTWLGAAAPGAASRWSAALRKEPGPTSAESSGETVPAQVLEVAGRLLRLPRHLGVHPGGMVLCDRPVTQVCPVRWAAKENRSVLQWDKDDCAAAGLVKLDLLGLGELTALRLSFTSLSQRGETVPETPADQGAVAGAVPAVTAGARGSADCAPSASGGVSTGGRTRPSQAGQAWSLHTLPEDDPAVYRLLSAADTVGVFQVESRAQMATLPRLRPSTFYDIVVEVALIRPGPIQGDAVSPYIRRRLGHEPVTYLHEVLRPALARTLGVPLFQEQLMQIAVDAAGFTPAEADTLRQAMGSKRSTERMEALHDRFVAGMEAHGIDTPTAETVFDQLRAFADFGFPESHAFSFAYLVYASAWLKVRRPEDFYAGVLAAQPMGFWSPQSLVADARRHGVRVLPTDVNASAVLATVEQRPAPGAPGSCGGGPAGEDGADPWGPVSPSPHALTFLDVHGDLGVRLGLASLRGLGGGVAQEIVSQRLEAGPYRDVEDLAQRVRLGRRHLETLAACGALSGLGTHRREALWAAGPLASGRLHRAAKEGDRWFQPPLPGTAVAVKAPALPVMGEPERQAADIRLSGVSPRGYPTVLVRSRLGQAGVLTLAEAASQEPGRRVRAAGVVTHRQHPRTATGVVFLSLEDETGLLNVVCPAGVWRRYQDVGRRAAALVVRGLVERADGAVSLVAERLDALPGVVSTGSRDWR
ncbi:DNA polymerase III subunit alpha [Actinomyces sp. 2119]|uniref:DNA polymerase III subunit alpha n=1 Tax=Actinomyces sp. 2119 TaxID=2321393 RepID=UPI000E6CAFCD|nr:DNA polymerase III subunit alpha [Actinomyces sp. 2119]RJF44852.1 DNA polymerase III subunit alpha [Actinomyces sp. 2119]